MTVAMITLQCASVPTGEPGPLAEELAQHMLQATGYDNWIKNTAAVSFTFRNGDKIFWDKKRNLVEVVYTSWGDEIKVQFSQLTYKALITEDGKTVTGKKFSEYLETANSRFINHTFWLNPLFHIHSPGTIRELVDGKSLLVRFSSGGVTPGDSYLFIPDEKYLVKEMKLWVKIVPFKGSTARFEDYITTETGVRIATSHPYLILNVRLENIKMYPTYPESPDGDRFQALLSL